MLLALLVTATASGAAAQHPGWRGEVISRHDLIVAAEVAGRLLEVQEPGHRVAAGDMLARLDERDLDIALRQALNAHELARLEALRRQERLARASALVERNLFARGELRELELDLEAARVGERVAQATVDQARLDLERSRMLAPVGGTVVERMRQAGEYVEVADPVLRLVGSEALEIAINVPLAEAGRLSEGTSVTLEFDEQRTVARVVRVVPVADPPARQFQVFVHAPDLAWPVGAVVRVRVD